MAMVRVPNGGRRTRAFPGLRRRRRTVRVRVLDGGREVDAFLSSRADVLEVAAQPLRAPRASGNTRIEYTGVEDESLPLGLDHIRRKVPLADLPAAKAFLAA